MVGYPLNLIVLDQEMTTSEVRSLATDIELALFKHSPYLSKYKKTQQSLIFQLIVSETIMIFSEEIISKKAFFVVA